MPPHAQMQDFSLYSADGARKYLNRSERQRFLAEVAKLPTGQALYCRTLAWTGGRLSEVLALRPSSFSVDGPIVAIRTLKRRKFHIREVPIPPELIEALDSYFKLSIRQRNPRAADSPLWPWHRTTAWRIVKRTMHAAGLSGIRACPKGLRHAFGVATLGVVPLNVRQKWLGHARSETTDIYSAVCGPEELAFAARFWRQREGHVSSDAVPPGIHDV